MSCPGAIECRRDTKNRRRRTIHGWTVTSRLTSLSNGVIVNAVNVFTNACAELAVLRLPTFIEEIRSERYSENKALIGAFLAVTTAQLPVQSASWASRLLSRHHYALYAKDMLGGSSYRRRNSRLFKRCSLLRFTNGRRGTSTRHGCTVVSKSDCSFVPFFCHVFFLLANKCKASRYVS